MKDQGPKPYVVNIEQETVDNENFRTALWTGSFLQTTLMSIEPGSEIGLEVHHDTDQFLRVEAGIGLVQMGDSAESLDFEQNIEHDDAIFVPTGKWHNITNTGDTPLKVYSIYAPAHHPHGTVHATKAEADEAEEHEHDHQIGAVNSMCKSDGEHKNLEAQAILEAALGGEKLKSEVKVTSGDQIRQELLDRAEQKQRAAQVPESIKDLSFAYNRSRLGSNFAKRSLREGTEAKAKLAKSVKERSERLAKVGMKETLSGKKDTKKPDRNKRK